MSTAPILTVTVEDSTRPTLPLEGTDAPITAEVSPSAESAADEAPAAEFPVAAPAPVPVSGAPTPAADEGDGAAAVPALDAVADAHNAEGSDVPTDADGAAAPAEAPAAGSAATEAEEAPEDLDQQIAAEVLPEESPLRAPAAPESAAAAPGASSADADADAPGAAAVEDAAVPAEPPAGAAAVAEAAVLDADAAPADDPAASATAPLEKQGAKRKLQLHETPNKRARPAPTVAESVLQYHRKTPPRFHSLPRTQSQSQPGRAPSQASAAGPSPAGTHSHTVMRTQLAAPSPARPALKGKYTIPKPFHLSGPAPRPPAAAMGPPLPIPKGILEARRAALLATPRPSVSALTPRKATTVPKPFRLSVGNAVRSSSVASIVSVAPAPFKATPLNRRMLNSAGESGVPFVTKRESTVPQDFACVKREQERQAAKALKAAAKQQAEADQEKENVPTGRVLRQRPPPKAAGPAAAAGASKKAAAAPKRAVAAAAAPADGEPPAKRLRTTRAAAAKH